MESEICPLTKRLLNDAGWKGKDAFPSTSSWQHDIEALLQFLKKNSQLEKFWPTLTSRRTRQRNSAFAEARIARFLVELGCEVTDWKPELLTRKTPEFEIRTQRGEHVVVEVKAPDWQAQLSKEDIAMGRTREPKSVQAEARSFSTIDPIKKVLDHAAKQLPEDQPTLVGVVDDLFQSPAGEYPADVLIPQIRTFFEDSGYAHIGGVLFLNAVETKGKVVTRARFVENPCAGEKSRLQDLKRILSDRPSGQEE